MKRYRLNRIVNQLHRAAGHSALLAALAVKVRNQCEGVIGYALGEDAEVTDAGNSEQWLVGIVGGQVTQFLDIGANVGDWAASLLEANANANGALCEPVDWCYASLLKRFGGNPKLQLLRMAMGESVGRSAFFVVPGNAKTSSFMVAGGQQELRRIEVEVTTVDALVEQRKMDRVDFLKCDCEGFDLHVLKGAKGVLGAGKVDLIQFEYNSAWPAAGNTLSFALQYLKSFGFQVFLLRRKGLWKFDYEKWREFERFANFVAMRPGSLLADSLRRAGAFR